MKKILVCSMISLTVSLVASSQKLNASKVPAAVKEGFTRQFPGVAAKWEKEDGDYEAGFKQDGHEMSAVFTANGTLKETETVIAVAELPATVKSYMNTHYKDASIKEAAKITSPGGKTEYEAAIKGKDIIFDATGKFLREATD